jgi:Fur family transcriptional regulator, ferric uptake regulator
MTVRGAARKQAPSAPVPATGRPDATVEQAMSLIRARGGRGTASRRAVIEALIEAGGELRDADQIVDAVHDRHPSINDSTVYRTLDLLEHLGLVRHVHLGHGPSQWYLSDERRRWYLTCTRCGRAIEADSATFDSMVAEVAVHTGFTIDPGHFAVTGTCAACRRE